MGKSALAAILAAATLGGSIVAAQPSWSNPLVCSCTDWEEPARMCQVATFQPTLGLHPVALGTRCAGLPFPIVS